MKYQIRCRLQILFLLISILVLFARSTPNSVNVGFLSSQLLANGQVNIAGNQCLAAFLMAVRAINNKTDGLYDDILPNTTLKFAIRSSDGSYANAVRDSIDLTESFNRKGIVAVIGQASDDEAKASALALSEYGILSISYGATTPLLSDSNIYKYAMTVLPSKSYQGRVIADIITNHFNWKAVSLFSVTNPYYKIIADDFLAAAKSYGLTVYLSDYFEEGSNDFTEIIDTVKPLYTKIFVLFMSQTDAARLLSQGYDQGLFIEGTQIIGMLLS